MVSVDKKIGILVTLLLAMLLTCPVDAAYVHGNWSTSTQLFEPMSDGLTYVYAPLGTSVMPATQYLIHSQDVSVTRYSYSLQSWAVSTASFNGPATREYTFGEPHLASWGWLSDRVFLPDFFKITNSTTELPELAATQTRLVFPLTVGTLNSVVIESHKVSIGTFSLSNEEFVHVTVGSRQDALETYCAIIGPNNEALADLVMDDGDIQVMPFKPVGPGEYQLWLESLSSNAGLVAFEVGIQSVVPDEISFGEVIQGTLSGSELLIDPDDGSMIHQEKAPAAHTYKFRSNYTYPGMLQYSMNLPEMDSIIYDLYQPYLLVQSDAFVNSPLRIRYATDLDATGETYHYQSFQNEVYYVTVIGMEDVGYTLYHAVADADHLPVNTPFFIQNDNYDQQLLYMLDLASDSVLRANYSNVLGGGYSWNIWSVFDDMYYRPVGPSPASTFHDADTYYLPAGRYLVEADAAAENSEGFYQFNIGPVIDGEGGFAVPLGGLLGVRFNSQPLGWYNVTLQMTTKDNVTAYADYVIFNTHGGVIAEDLGAMGNRQSGVSWQAYGSNQTEFIFDRTANGSFVMVTSPYSVVNNTVGLPGTAYGHYTVDYSVQAYECSSDVYNGSATVNLATASVGHDFTLGEPAETYETYSLVLNCSEGVWLNVSVHSEDVDDWTASAYQVISGYTQHLSWSNLDDTLVGTPPSECYFQFGTIGGTVRIDFVVERTGAGEGVLSVMVTPFTTNVLEDMPLTDDHGGGGGDWVAQNLGIILAGAGAAAVAVVVIVIIAKRRGKL